MKQIIIVEPKTLSAKDKEKLTKNGYLVIEHKIPSEVRIVTQANEIETHMLFMSAMKGAMDDIYSKEKFANELHKRLLEKESKSKTE